MTSAFLINDKKPEFRNPSTMSVEINGISSEATRSDSGDITTLNKVNSVPKLTLSWDCLTLSEMEALCECFGITIAEYEGEYVPKSMEELVYKVTVRLPMGVRSFSAYVGDTLSAELVDYADATDESVGGEYWTGVSLSLVGTGEGWKV